MSLTARILLLVLLALAPALAIQGYNEVALRTARGEAVGTDALATARAVSDEFAQVADGIRQALDLVAEDPSIASGDPAACTSYLTRVGARLPHVILLALTDAAGVVVCNSAASAPGAYTNAARGYHRRALTEGGFVMGGYTVGFATGRASIHFAQPKRTEDGRVTGVLVAAVDLDWLSDRLQQNLRQPGTAVLVTDPDGTIIVRRPDAADWIGRKIPPERQARLVAQGVGVRIDTGLDGRQLVIATTMPSGPLAGVRVVVGRDRDVAFADIDAATRRGLVLIALGAVLALAAALLAARVFIRRPFERLLRTAAAWRAGDLAVRTGLSGSDEFGRLGRQLDAMAGTLHRNEGELRAEIDRGRAMQERQVTLLHELNHRVKNTLATVQALARQSEKSDPDGGGGRRLEARILSLSKTHDLLTRDEWSGASLAELLENELSPYRVEPDHITLDGPEVALPPRHVLAIGMTMHELTTNAAKYGALSAHGGRVQVAWSVKKTEAGVSHLRLTWRESGGPPVVAPTRSGFGTRLIAGSVRRELAGQIDLAFETDGLRCYLDVPLDPTASAILVLTQ
ncbi:HWE histidine kinase domain-containing protein [Methylobacterium sp. NMS12]|uniref:sensor histidine kinase n=1 Tax=Methylobacterium sp. NMS12 TaxID=3079766 RepID=UPI003F885270